MLGYVVAQNGEREDSLSKEGARQGRLGSGYWVVTHPPGGHAIDRVWLLRSRQKKKQLDRFVYSDSLKGRRGAIFGG